MAAFAESIKEVALSCKTGAEASHFIFWVRSVSPEVKESSEDYDLAQALIPVARYWDDNGLYEDQLAPAIAALRVYSAFTYGEDTAAPLLELHNKMVEEGADCEDIDYSAFYLSHVVPVLKSIGN